MMDESKEGQIELARQRTSLAIERNLLAAERTFSAWVRTGLAGVGGGVLMMKMISYSQAGHAIAAGLVGQLLIIWGLMIFIFAYSGYRRACKRLSALHPDYRPSLGRIGLITATLIVASLVILIITRI